MDNKINCLTELIEWINNSKTCCVSEQEDDYFYIEAPNNADVFINLETDDDINDILYRTIELLENFDADERFMEIWSKDFAEHNHFKPSQFIRMLQEDEETFRELAYKLREFLQCRHNNPQRYVQIVGDGCQKVLRVGPG